MCEMRIILVLKVSALESSLIFVFKIASSIRENMIAWGCFGKVTKREQNLRNTLIGREP